MTKYQDGSCSCGGNDVDELRQHSHRKDRVGVHEGAAERTESRFGGRTGAAAVVGFGVLTAAAASGVCAWKTKDLRSMASMAGGLLVEMAEMTTKMAAVVAENDYLKSASGAGTTLRSYHG